MARPSRGFVRYWVPALAWMVAILVGTSLPRVPRLGMLAGKDKLLHVAAYAVLGLLLLRAFRRGSRYAAALAAFASLMLGGIYGVVDELHQLVIPGRTCSGADVLADLAGVTAAVLIVWLVGEALVRRGARGQGPDTSTQAREMSKVTGVKELTQADFESEILSSEIPGMVDFWAPWCGPCYMVSPTVEKMAGEYEGKLNVGKINLDQYPELANRYSIRSIPAVLLFNGGDLVDMIIGVQPEDAFREAIDKVLGE